MGNIVSEIIDKSLFGTSVFKDETSFLRDYVPEELPCREKDLARIARDFRPIIIQEKGDFSVNIAIVGRPGVGKTALSKLFKKNFIKSVKAKGKKVNFVYFNCYTFRTKSAIIRHLLEKYYNVFQARGFSDDQNLSQLMKSLENKNEHLVLILDEAAILGSEDILSFLHAPEAFSFGKSRISIILINRLTEYKQLLKVHSSERIQDTIELSDYTAEELYKILNYRIKIGFYDGVVSPEVLDQVIEIASTTHNARHGIEILYNAGKIADREGKQEISPEMIRLAKSHVYPELRPGIFEELNEHELITAIAVSRVLIKDKKTSTTIDEVFEYYCIVCEEENFEKHAKVTYRKHVDALVQSGIIFRVVESIGGGKRGRRSRITLQDIPAEIVHERANEILNQKKTKKSL